MWTRFCAMMRSPAPSMRALTAPVRLRRVTSGFRMEKVRSMAISVSGLEWESGALIAAGSMSDKAVTVTQKGGAFDVVVRDGGGETRHEVTVSAADLARLGAGQSGAALVEAAFAFLLDREPKEAILARFDLSVISRYFPEFERELPRYLAAAP